MPAFANKCPKCGTKVKIRDPQLDGKRARCPKCSAKFHIKAPPALKPSTNKPPSEEFSFLGRISDSDLIEYEPDDLENLDEAEAVNEDKAPPPSPSAEIAAVSARRDMLLVVVVLFLGLLLLAGVSIFLYRQMPDLFDKFF